MANIDIQQLEQAINYWRDQGPTSIVLGKEVRILSDVYGQMIFDHHETISSEKLTEEQNVLLEKALAAQPGREVR